jgi:hypothetical protein
VRLRAATAADAEPVARLVIDGFASYRSFAPPGWEPPPVAGEMEIVQRLLGDEGVWCRLAEADDEVVGQVTFMAAARSAVPHARLLTYSYIGI